MSVHLNSGLIRGMASLKGNNLVVFYCSVHLNSGLIRGMASLKGNNLVVFY